MITQRSASPISDQPEPAKPQGMSQQTRTTIAICGLIACLLVAGGIVYFLLFGSSPRHRSVAVDPKQQTVDNRAMFRAPRPPPRAEVIVKENDNLWSVNSLNGRLYIKKQPDGSLKMVISHQRNFLSPDQATLVSALFRARNDPSMAKEWGLSDDQLTELKKVRLNGGVAALSNADRDQMLQLWDSYNKTTDTTQKSDVEKKLATRVDEIAKATVDASRKTFAAELEDVKKILTPDQLTKMAQH